MFYPFDFQYLLIKPDQAEGDLGQFFDCLDQLEPAIEALEKQGVVVRITCFFARHPDLSYKQYRDIFGTLLSRNPALVSPSLIAQAPTDGSDVQLLLTSIQGVRREMVHYSSHIGLDYVVWQSLDSKWLFLGGCECYDSMLATRAKASGTFKQVQQVLAREGMVFNQLLRQWNYIGGILGQSIGKDGMAQNYQEFNEVRNKWYSGQGLEHDYPAATGIGTRDKGIHLDLIAGQPGRGMQFFSLKNPCQLDAHQYSEQQLIGEGRKSAPLFERGKVAFADRHGHVWVSGTAAIRGEESIAGSVMEQSRMTCDTIDRLIQTDNLIRSGLPSGNYKLQPLYFRGYVKNLAEGPLVAEFIEKRYPTAVVHVLEADVCREELLVEIEAEFRLLAE